MLNLVRKDLRSTALYLCGIVPVMALTSVGGLRTGERFFWWAVIMAAVLVATPIALDWSEGADRLLHCLPVSRRDVVRARYLSSVVLSAASFAISMLVASLFAWAVAARGGSWPEWMCLETALAFLIVASASTALYLPCVFRFGFGVGSGEFGAIVLVGIVVLESIGRKLASPAIGLPDPAAASVTLAGGPAARLAGAAIGSLGQAGAALTVIGAAGGLLLASMWLSMRVHEKQEF